MSQDLNFANQNLRDRSFKGRNLIGADFSGADLRGCDFYRSQLQSANFANIRTGKSPRQRLMTYMGAFAMSLIFAGTIMIATILLITFVTTFIFGTEFVNRETIYWVAIVAIVVFAMGFAITFTSSIAIANPKTAVIAMSISLMTAFISGYCGSTLTKILVSGAFNAVSNSIKFNVLTALLTFLAIEPLQIFGSLYLFRFAINASRMIMGTKFQYADLTNASFHNAVLISCDFSNAIMNDVDLEQAQILRCKL